jgi:methionine-rich copper-binding protein CopC
MTNTFGARAGMPLTAAFLLLASVTSAAAHAHLKTASPAPKSVLTSAPAEIAIDFTEALEPSLSTIEVRDSSGGRVDQGDLHLAPTDARHFAVSLKPLSPGTYTVIWHATATDTHKTDGTYTFEIAK